MRTVNIAFDPTVSAAMAVASLPDVELRQGDHLRVSTEQKLTQAELFTLMLVVIYMVARHFERSKTKDAARINGDRVLNDLLTQYNSAEDIEKALESEYGIEISLVERDAEDTDWRLLSTQGVVSAYGTDEPDYSNVTVGEPNPHYKKGPEA